MKTGLIAMGGKIEDLDTVEQRLRHFVPDLAFDWVIAADSGAKWLEMLDIIPDELIGDFDSISDLNHYLTRWQGVHSETFPAEKDVTDSEIAVDAALRKNPDLVVIIGGFGGRADHMLSTLFLTGRSPSLVMIDSYNVARVIEGPYEMQLTRESAPGKYISIVPLSDVVEGVTIQGVKYPLDRATILFGQTIGVSNELISENGTLAVEKGRAVLFFTQDASKRS
ncbi:MAG: thiamine pyrophosphokinae [Clostridiales bacterium]|jgi:thiamine pyrophosphokinase|nr:thiamine pyrophosphokinae [Clostridiales bacterium]